MHRIISIPGGVECFACGTQAPNDGSIEAVPCRPGGWAHPPVILGLNPNGPRAGEAYVETCAAHPYADCSALAVEVVMGRGTPAPEPVR